MIKVYFETENYSELVAVFANEDLYVACVPTLELAASLSNSTLTESVEEEDLSDKF
jgi:hypothetical protein